MSSRSPRCVSRSAVVEETLDMISAVKKANQSLVWGAVNISFLSVVLYDILYKCPAYSLAVYYGEVALAVILALSTAFHITRYVYVNWCLKPVILTPQQRRLMGVSKLDPHFKGSPESMTPKSGCSPEKQRSPSPVRHTPKKLFSSPSASSNVSTNTSLCSPSSLNSSAIGNSFMSDIQQSPGVSVTPVNTSSVSPFSPASPAISPMTLSQNGNQTQSSFLYRCTYQLAPLVSAIMPGRGRGDSKKRDSDSWTGLAHSSPLSSGSSSSPSTSSPGTGSSLSHGSDTWQCAGVNVANLERWTMNLRVWLSQTVVERVVQEIDSINEALGWNNSIGGVAGSKEGGTEEQGIGNVGLDRLRSAALVPHVITAAPNLSLLIPFLEVTPNQKYLVARIRKLAEGGCMSSFNWSGENAGEGVSGGRQASDVSQCPTDAFILAHLFATYLDTQMPSLPPSAVFLSQETLKTPASVLSSIPSQSSSPGAISPGPQATYIPLPLESPESRPFSIRHFARIPEELARKRKGAEEGGGHMIIYQARQCPPHFQLVTPEEVLDIGKGRNNLFHTILLFLHLIKTREHGMLGGVSLGKSGISMLWIIDGE
ncbi:transmembrane protein 209 isoform X4 [Hetaerina americana]|uniref:transmembrane protein 209 isoform X4 n=1 Tax=Hetaerina americana TaxID=62018 RepID=UPI003A7F3607